MPVGGEIITKIKEKTFVSKCAKEKIQAAPKFLRRGLLTGTKKLQGQLRDAAEGGRREDTEADRTQAAARTATQRAAYRLKKLAHGKKKVWTGRLESCTGTDDADPENSTPDIQTEQVAPSDSVEPVQIKTREASDRSVPVEGYHPDSPRSEPTQIKTKDNCTRPQTVAPAPEPVIENAIQPERQASYSSEQGRQKFVRERVRDISVRQTEGRRQSSQAASVPTQELRGGGQTVDTADHGPASELDGQLSQPLEQGRQKFVQEKQEKATAQRRRNYRGPERTEPARQRNASDAQPRHNPALSAQDGKQPTKNTVRESVSNGRRRIKESRFGAKAVGRTTRQTVNGADSSGKVVKAGGRSAQTMQQMARAAVQARQRAVQAAGATRRTTAAVGKPVTKAVVSALRGAVSAIQTALAPLAAGGGAVIAVVLVLCLVGALLLSPLGIFFSGEDSGGQTISAVVREINLEYDTQLEEIQAGVTYDKVSLSGSRASWIEILAVYAVKTATDPTNGQEVVTMSDEKKTLLKQMFWDMNELSSFTSTVPGEDGEEGTTTLHITVTSRTADEMANIYGFNAEQHRQLTELLSDEYRKLWNAVL